MPLNAHLTTVFLLFSLLHYAVIGKQKQDKYFPRYQVVDNVQGLPEPSAYKQVLPPNRANFTPDSTHQYSVMPMKDKIQHTFQWHAGKWSACPQTCGDFPTMQVRNVVCITRVGNTTQSVSDQHCMSQRLPKPFGVNACGTGPCPSWTPGDYTECQESKCTRYLMAVQTRELYCTFPNGTTLPKKNCDRTTRPRWRKTCHNPNCTAEWRETEWSQCTKSCSTGVQMRTIGCYWRGSDKPARNACEGNQRPKIIQTCNEHTCAAALSSCVDVSRYCSIVAIMRKCNQMQYREKCCLTCYHAPRT